MADIRVVMNKRDEAWLHDSDADVAVPFEMTVYGNEAVIEYYPSAHDTVCEYVARFGEGVELLLSREAIEWGASEFGTFLEQYGFCLSPDSADYYMNYALKASESVHEAPVQRIFGDEEFNDLTDTDIKGLCEEGYIVYAAVVDGNIVAVANTGEPINENTKACVEIGVDTASEHRRKGYARACAAALIRELHDLGYRATYECASGNEASVRLVKSLGGSEQYKKLYFVGFRDE